MSTLGTVTVSRRGGDTVTDLTADGGGAARVDGVLELARALAGALRTMDPAVASLHVVLHGPQSAEGMPRDAVWMIARELHLQYVGAPNTFDQVADGWVATTRAMLAAAGVVDLREASTPAQRVAFARAVYDKMTESTGRFDTSTQRGAHLAFAERLLGRARAVAVAALSAADDDGAAA